MVFAFRNESGWSDSFHPPALGAQTRSKSCCLCFFAVSPPFHGWLPARLANPVEHGLSWCLCPTAWVGKQHCISVQGVCLAMCRSRYEEWRHHVPQNFCDFCFLVVHLACVSSIGVLLLRTSLTLEVPVRPNFAHLPAVSSWPFLILNDSRDVARTYMFRSKVGGRESRQVRVCPTGRSSHPVLVYVLTIPLLLT